ncbi:aly/REF export factor 2-like [Symsagittifera roscoffensis]|uniref:aly/REF export factor 2-like n=1 Tax=Symsagittifera roscoffensis TaxID=84072 RepID=UPI00307BB55F
MDQSLDQFIKDRKIKYPGRGGRGRGRVAVRGNPRGGSTSRGRGGNYYNSRGRGSMIPRRNFQIQGSRGFRKNQFGYAPRGRGMQMNQRRYYTPNFRQQGPPRQNSRGGFFNRNAQFNRPSPFAMQRGGGVMKRGQQSSGFVGNRIPTKLYISNLDFGVSNQDIKDLFSEFGKMRRFGVNFAQGGKSLGTAEVHFENRGSAVRAIQKYNNVTLDGRPMKLAISEPSEPNVVQRVPIANRIPPVNQPRAIGRGITKKLVDRSKQYMMNRGRGGQRGRGQMMQTFRGRGGMRRGQRGSMRGRGRGGGRGGNKQTAPTQEQLDADLAAFTAKSE